MTREIDDHISRQRRTGRSFLREFIKDILFETIWLIALVAAIALVIHLIDLCITLHKHNLHNIIQLPFGGINAPTI